MTTKRFALYFFLIAQLSLNIWGESKPYYLPTNTTVIMDFTRPEIASAIAVDPDGNVFIGGNDGEQTIIGRINSAGFADWLQGFAPENPGDEVELVGLASDGNVYALYDYTPNALPQRTVILAWDNQRNFLWSESITGSQSFNENVYSTGISVNQNGNLAVSAFFFYAGLSSLYNDQFGIALLNTDGQLLSTDSGFGSFSTENGSRAYDVAIDEDGVAYLAGTVEKRNSFFSWNNGAIFQSSADSNWRFANYTDANILYPVNFSEVGVNAHGDLVAGGKRGSATFIRKPKGEHQFEKTYPEIGGLIDLQVDESGRTQIFAKTDAAYVAITLDGAGNIISETNIGVDLPITDAHAYFTETSLHLVATYNAGFSFKNTVISAPQGGSGIVYLRYQLNPDFKRGTIDSFSSDTIEDKVIVTVNRTSGSTDGDIHYTPMIRFVDSEADEADFADIPVSYSHYFILEPQVILNGDTQSEFSISLNPSKLRLNERVLNLEFEDFEGGTALGTTEFTMSVPANMSPWINWLSSWYSESEIRSFDSMGLYLDPDGDSRNNLFEFALGTDPTSADGTPLTIQQMDNDVHEVAFMKPNASDNFTYQLMKTDDLIDIDWYEVGADFLRDHSANDHYQWFGWSWFEHKGQGFYSLKTELIHAP
ncbi:MAG: hypothetical protein ACSHYA_08645 [Opitutaceae bacterium]